MLKPGYKQTDIGVLPEEWEVGNLGELTTKVGSGITPTGGSKVYKDHGRPFVRSQNVGWGNLLLDDVMHIDEATHSTFTSTEIKKQDVLLNITGASIGRAAMADKRIVDGNVNQHVCIIRTDKKLLNPYFLSSFLISEIGQNIIDSFQAGGNRQGLNFQQIKSFQIPLPPPAEQQAIADTLGAVDALLREQRALLAKKRDLKLATQTALLTQARRLPGFTGEWQEKRLDEIAQIATGSTPPTTDRSNYGTEFLFVSPSDLGTNKYITTTEKNLSEKGFFISRKFPVGSILFTCIGSTIGKIGLASTKLTSNQQINSIFPNAGFLNEFLYYALSYIAPKIRASASEQAVPMINKSEFGGITVLMPTLLEQRSIANILTDMDTELAALAAQLAKTEALKQGLMQDLLTGTIRLRGAAPLSPSV